MQPQTYPGRGLSRMSLILSVAVLAWLGILTVVALVVGGPARFLSLLTGLGMVVAIGVLVYRMAKAGGSLKVTRDLIAFGGERIYFRDIESMERGLPDRANQTFRVEVRTRERVHHLDLMDYRIEPDAMPALLAELQEWVAALTPPPGAPAPPGPRSP